MLYPDGHSLLSVTYGTLVVNEGGTHVPDGAWFVTVPYTVGVGMPYIRLKMMPPGNVPEGVYERSTT